MCAVSLGWGIISNIEEILTNIGIGILTAVVVIIILILIFAICNFIGRKKPIPTIVLFICSLGLLLHGIFTFCSYQYNRYDAFYTINEISVQGTTSEGNNISCTIPAGSLISEVDRNTDVDAYMGGIELIPTTRECKYKTENDIYVIAEIEKSNMKKCGWVDCFGKLHEE